MFSRYQWLLNLFLRWFSQWHRNKRTACSQWEQPAGLSRWGEAWSQGTHKTAGLQNRTAVGEDKWLFEVWDYSFKHLDYRQLFLLNSLTAVKILCIFYVQKNSFYLAKIFSICSFQVDMFLQKIWRVFIKYLQRWSRHVLSY